MSKFKARNLEYENSLFQNFDKEKFWDLIDYSKAYFPSNKQKQIELLVEVLSERTEDEILEFFLIKKWFGANAHTCNLMAVAAILNNYLSDDSFLNYVYWLISEGKEKYYDLLGDPEKIGIKYDSRDQINGSSENFYVIGGLILGKKDPNDIDPFWTLYHLLETYDEKKKEKYYAQYKETECDWEYIELEDMKKRFPKFFEKFYKEK